MIGVLPTGSGLTLFASNPLPNLSSPPFINEDNEMLVGAFGDLAFNPPAGLTVWYSAIASRGASKRRHAAFFGKSSKREGLAVNADLQPGVVVIPAELLNEQEFEIEGREERPNPSNIKSHRLLALRCI
jgi:hypothetical protein